MRWLTRILSILYSEKGSLISVIFDIVHGAAELEMNVQYRMFLYRCYSIIVISWKTQVREGIRWFLIFHISTEGFSQSKRSFSIFLSISHKIEKKKKRLLIAGGNRALQAKMLYFDRWIFSLLFLFSPLFHWRGRREPPGVWVPAC